MEINQNSRETGFSLLEMLFVLSIVMILVSISVPFVHKKFVQHEINQFFTVFDSDILFIQNQALEGRELWIHLLDDYYVIKEHKHPDLVTRDYPKGLHATNLSHRRIEFWNTGTVKEPNTYFFYDQYNERHKVVFPFGKGRHYIEKE